PPRSPLFPYTTLFRSHRRDADPDGPRKAEHRQVRSGLQHPLLGTLDVGHELGHEADSSGKAAQAVGAGAELAELELAQPFRTNRSEEHTSELQSRGHL